MKAIIVAVLVAFTNSLVANPVIVAELQKMEAATERQLAAKEDRIAAMAAEIVAKDSQLAAKDSLIAELKNNPDLDQALKVKFNQALVDAKTSISKLTEEIISKFKKGETK